MPVTGAQEVQSKVVVDNFVFFKVTWSPFRAGLNIIDMGIYSKFIPLYELLQQIRHRHYGERIHLVPHLLNRFRII